MIWQPRQLHTLARLYRVTAPLAPCRTSLREVIVSAGKSFFRHDQERRCCHGYILPAGNMGLHDDPKGIFIRRKYSACRSCAMQATRTACTLVCCIGCWPGLLNRSKRERVQTAISNLVLLSMPRGTALQLLDSLFRLPTANLHPNLFSRQVFVSRMFARWRIRMIMMSCQNAIMCASATLWLHSKSGWLSGPRRSIGEQIEDFAANINGLDERVSSIAIEEIAPVFSSSHPALWTIVSHHVALSSFPCILSGSQKQETSDGKSRQGKPNRDENDIP